MVDNAMLHFIKQSMVNVAQIEPEQAEQILVQQQQQSP